MRFDSQIKVADLQATHPNYDAEQVRDHNNFYEGGRNFPLDLYLRRKPIESAAAPAGGYHQGADIGNMRTIRVNSAYYANHFAGVVNELLSAIVYDPPQFKSASNDAYWTDLNTNADGKGGPITLQVMNSLWSRMMFNRSYYQVIFAKTPDGVSLDQQEKNGGLQARIIHICGDLVDDWEYDDEGDLKYVRKHFKCAERADPDAPAGKRTLEKHYWIYHTPAGVYTYTALTEVGKEFDKDHAAQLVDEKPNTSGVFQIVEVQSALDFFVADALFPVAKQIFNASSDSSFARFTSATCTPVLASEKEPDEVLRLGPFNLLNVGVNGKLTFATAQADFFNSLDAAEEKHKAELYMQVHAMAAATKAAAATGQNVSRESGDAIGARQKPLHAFLQAFAVGEIAALDKCAKIIQKIRNKPVDDSVKLDGLMEYDTAELDANIARAKDLCAIVQTPPPIIELLMKRIGMDLADKCDADKEARDAISNYEAPEPAAPAPAMSGSGTPVSAPPPAPVPTSAQKGAA